MRSVIVAIPMTVFLLAGCQRDPAAPSPSGHTQGEKPTVQETKLVKVKVTAGGDIFADGQPVTLEQLAAKLADLKQAGGEVWYHRENPACEPHPNAIKVIDLVAENKLPLKLSAKPDFSDSVDDKGVSHSGNPLGHRQTRA
jgi:biopolymer transport protein ExbD